MSRSVFLSYCRTDSSRVQRLAEDVRVLGYSPWLDQEIGGGQAWWDEILRQIRAADIFVVALSAAALESVACLREYEYAAALKKPILPICVSADVTPALMPAALAALQIVMWKPDDARAALRLSRALMNMPAALAALTIEPTPPPAPLSYLASLHERVTAAQALGLQEQSALVLELKQRARAGKDREELRALMQAMRARIDLYASVADELDEVLQEHGPTAAPTSQPLDDTGFAANASRARGREVPSAQPLVAYASTSREDPASEAEAPAALGYASAARKSVRAGPVRSDLTDSGLQPERPSRDSSTSVLASSKTHASLSPIETANTTVTRTREHKHLIPLAAAAACTLLTGIGVLAYVLQSPQEKPPATHASPPVAPVTLEPEHTEDFTALSTDHDPTEIAVVQAPPSEATQPTVPTPEATPAAPTPKKPKARPTAEVVPTPSGLSAKALDVVHIWKVTAKQDCEPNSVRSQDCIAAENAAASLDRNGTATWGACSCRLNSAARKAIEDAADFIH